MSRGEVTRDVDIDSTHDIGEEVLGVPSASTGEKSRGFNRIVSSARSSEVIRDGRCSRKSSIIRIIQKVINVIALTIVGDVEGSARDEDGGGAGIIETCGVCFTVLDLERQ